MVSSAEAGNLIAPGAAEESSKVEEHGDLEGGGVPTLRKHQKWLKWREIISVLHTLTLSLVLILYILLGTPVRLQVKHLWYLSLIVASAITNL